MTGLQRTRSCSAAIKTTTKIIPSSISAHHLRSSSDADNFSGKFLLQKNSSHRCHRQHLAASTTGKFSSLLHSLLKLLSIPTCKWLPIPTHLSVSPSLGRRVTGTLFGRRRGHVTFAIQLDPRSQPVLLLEFATSTSSLIKEMSSGLVRIALESDSPTTYDGNRPIRKLLEEPRWTMYYNGRKCGQAISRTCGEFEWYVLNTVQSVSVGAGVIPMVDDGRKGSGSEGELLYMRAKFERVVGSRDSEAFYMMNPDGNGGPELSIFLLRI
ncbi:protein MIZU-KUSSEI 1-like [Cucurbita pepo subsp. pepo]|uniref:protein MIZU-KUSSEI 1-like n=1 Tax=Cucurbita pepo subsp. pepo TaxID=3664 RepID=UPI000C9D9CDA|nr:protein MIZU-KUSSEI 1-like [Cucurbita pepo subsp. pepo]